MDTNQAYFWTLEWQKAEKAASRDIQEGRVKTFQYAQDLLEELG